MQARGETACAFHLLGGCPSLTGQLGGRGVMFRFTDFYFDWKRNEPSHPDVECFYLHRCVTAPLEKLDRENLCMLPPTCYKRILLKLSG